ncbi:MAG: alpha/beta hydrolase [Actinomycetales bacterium]|nr:alpha/beta hydrolase [Actinomycetales bacterium]
MKIIMVPGFWLDASSWDAVVPGLRAAGHDVEPLTLPGLESRDADRSGIGLRTHVDAVVERIDASEGPVVLVGHSGGGAVISAAADARCERVVRTIYVDSGPLGDGGIVSDEWEGDGSDLPLPAWDAFEESELRDLDEEARATFRARAIPHPFGASTEPQRLSDERRYEIPTTLVASSVPVTVLRELIDAGHPWMAEAARMRDVEIVGLATGHWPQLTKPAELTAVILTAVG